MKLQSDQDLSDVQSKNDGKLLESIACALTVLSPQIVFTSPRLIAIPGVVLKGVVSVITLCFMTGVQKSRYLLPSADLLHPRIPKSTDTVGDCEGHDGWRWRPESACSSTS